MATGDTADMAGRLRALLPRGWFPDPGSAPVLDALLLALGDTWARIYALIQYVRAQARLASASGVWLDGAAADFFGARVARLPNEGDDAFRGRIKAEIFRQRNTRAGLIAALTDLTGRAPAVFEPANTQDTGGWSVGGIGFDVGGGWGETDLPFQCFVTAYRPHAGGIAGVGGWDSGAGGWNAGAAEWSDNTMVTGQVSDALIYATASGVMPAGSIAWVQISN